MEEDLASSSGDITWKRIWRMCVPLKFQDFWWRVVNGFLPTKGIMHRRHIESIANCDVCGAEESIKHVLMDCTMAKYCWDQAKVLTSVKVPRLHPLTWAHELVDPGFCSGKDAAVILCGMWTLWMARKKRQHGEEGVPMRVAMQWAKERLTYGSCSSQGHWACIEKSIALAKAVTQVDEVQC